MISQYNHRRKEKGSARLPNGLEWKTANEYPLIPLRFTALLVRLLESNGYDIDHLLKSARIPRSRLNKPDTRISWRQVRVIIGGAYRQTRHPALGLYFGQKLTPSDIGPLGVITHNSKNIKEGVKILEKYFEINYPHSRMELQVCGDEAIMRFHQYFEDRLLRRFLSEAWAASWSLSTKFYIGATTPQKYIFAYPAPKHYASVYTDVLEAPVEFDGDAFEVRFQKDVLDKPLPRRADAQVVKLAQKQCDKHLMVSQQYHKLIAEIYRILAGKPDKFPSLETLSKHLGTAPRTLSRNLQLFGTSYKDLVDSVRMSLAARYLKNTDLPIEEIANILHYSDPSNFRRAFKKRIGKAPSMYRDKFHKDFSDSYVKSSVSR